MCVGLAQAISGVSFLACRYPTTAVVTTGATCLLLSSHVLWSSERLLSTAWSSDQFMSSERVLMQRPHIVCFALCFLIMSHCNGSAADCGLITNGPFSMVSTDVLLLRMPTLPKRRIRHVYCLLNFCISSQHAYNGLAGDCGLIGESQRSAGVAIANPACLRVSMYLVFPGTRFHLRSHVWSPTCTYR